MEHRHDRSKQPHPSRILLKPRVVNGEQKRHADRTTTRRSIAVVGADGQISSSVPLINLSATGLQVGLGEDVAIGSTVSFEVLPAEVLPATVKWVHRDEQGIQIGAEWLQPLDFEKVWRIRSFDGDAPTG